jgi:phosphoribosylformylglycinamidine cyclo-ligase
VNDQHPESYTYQQAGVDNKRGAQAKERIGELIRHTYTDGVLGDFGHFGGMFRARQGVSQILVSSADSVGTKVLLAVHAARHDQIGVDLVNHSVNDILCVGATPLFFLDYFATSALDAGVLEDIVEGLSRACRDAGCALVGGETAQLPGIYHESTYDLAGFIVGTVEEDRIIDGSQIQPGHKLVGFASDGLHTNGYSLARAVFGLAGTDTGQIRATLEAQVPELGESLGDALLRPHRSYLQALKPFLENPSLSGLAHITGGGIVGNLERIIPKTCQAVVETSAWETPRLFRLVEQRGNVSREEMFQVFNMGIGFIAVAEPELADEMVASEPGAQIIGEIREATSEHLRVILTGVGSREPT